MMKSRHEDTVVSTPNQGRVDFCKPISFKWNSLLCFFFVEQAHLGSCPFHQVTCTNKNCDKIVQRRHLKQHENNECPWRILQCTHCFEPHPECQMEVGTVIVIEFTFSLFLINWIILEEELLVNISMYRPHEPSGRVRISLCN